MTSSGARPTASSQPQEAKRGRIFDIQRWSLNDGTGIRTMVFFKGCPLCCPWCSNPESRSREIVRVGRSDFASDGTSPKASCWLKPEDAYRMIGRDVTLEELESEIARDSVFHRVSGGGVTLSGGEILVQPDFVLALLARLQAKGVPCAIETTGHGNRDMLIRMGRLCEEVLFDFKIMDARRAKAILGINLSLVLDNFRGLLDAGINVIPRLPLVPDYTMSEENIGAILSFLKPFSLTELHLLPLHHYGASKYEMLGMPYPAADLPVPSDAEIDHWRQRCEAAGYSVTVGG
ncbi:[formate-C-acetyltransferase]-activating enzyme [uncultured Cohaesibacter sp.]|uniref:[formate-C-acetyltransferase]-activating enzyme n=1 Tax=uncultured Cohaesibacter sp. TaxID=1002546 RepID=UPI0029C9385A|nr:[formate-C-acetyltransferase]-activating enzyme [uncultured Cohaesibacter sp.]